MVIFFFSTILTSLTLLMYVATILSKACINAEYSSAKFKAPHAKSDPNEVKKWKEADDKLWKYVKEKVPSVLDHTGSSSFDEHLKGVQAVLRYWGAPDHLTNAGLFHSIYGTEGFQGFSLPLSERGAIQSLIGPSAEKLCFVFCMVDRSTVDETVFGWKAQDRHDHNKVYKLKARPELGRFDIFLDKEEWVDFIELTLADWLEQVEGAATKPSPLFFWSVGESYSYRRFAYRRMTDILNVERKERLAEIPKNMMDVVMATEGSDTRHLVQPRTPPMSEAAARAYDALRASGEYIPVDFSPQPQAELLRSVAEAEF
jgi:hypothetical protein